MIFMLVNFIISILQTQYREVHRISRNRILRGGRTTAHDVRDAANWLYRGFTDWYTGRSKVGPSIYSHHNEALNRLIYLSQPIKTHVFSLSVKP